MEVRGDFPNFFEERKLWKKGYRIVIGVDEAGRGAFAGPIVVGAVVFAPTPQMTRFFKKSLVFKSTLEKKNSKLKMKNWEEKIIDLGINDSKVLRPRKRKALAKEIKKLALAYSVASVSAGVINRIGIGKATSAAMRKGVAALKSKSQNPNIKENPYSLIFDSLRFDLSKTYVLVDAFHIKYLRGIGLARQKAIKKGDKKSLSIAAASILAKVHRDHFMKKNSRRFPKYRWAKNKGYGTREHQKAILRYGLTRLHRKVFVRRVISKW